MNSALKHISALRDHLGSRMQDQYGLTDTEIARWEAQNHLLAEAIASALPRLRELEEEFPELLTKGEEELLSVVSQGYLNFYAQETCSPYIPLTAQGPWIVTYGGAVIYDTGGYGMLGHGHNPEPVRAAMSQPQVMANIMTPSFAQYRLREKLLQKIGHRHSSRQCPFNHLIFMNSGSEAMGVALRISDAHAKRMTDPGKPHANKEIKILSFVGSFHGRTYRAARISGSTRKKYDAALASFRDHSDHIEVRVNDSGHLKELYERFEQDGIFIESLALEPVMGEGDPGRSLERAFYDTAREVTEAHGSFLIVDSIQAGLRAQGVLSIIDYPGFSDCLPPDMEIYSKALNGGQFPLSLLALRDRAASEYIAGTYGNTMTANPRALDVASVVLDSCTDELARNVREKGAEFVTRLKELQRELPEAIVSVQGTGLLVSAKLHENIPVVGVDGAEQRLRKRGINVIHGGVNSLRYTPWLSISSEEISLIVEKTGGVLRTLAKENSLT